MKSFLKKMIEGEDLTRSEMSLVMTGMIEEQYQAESIAAFLVAQKMKGITAEEVLGAVQVLRDKGEKLHIDGEVILDTCGTGGDEHGTFNISTTVALVAAAGGIKVLKHGNRSVSSKCGCADVLEALGVNIEVSKEKVMACLETCHLGFLYAPAFHKGMKHVQPIRKALGIKTLFNVLGPLIHPAAATHHLVGVYDESLLEVYATVLNQLGVKRAMIVHGSDGLDEITVTGTTSVYELNHGQVSNYTLNPEDYGIPLSDIEDLKGGDVEKNAAIITSILDNTSDVTDGMKHIVYLNAGVAFYITGIKDSIESGVKYARNLIESGQVKSLLETFVRLTHEEVS